VLAAVFDAARTQHYLTARELRDVPVIHPDVRVFAVDLRGRDIGLVYFDLMHREGKMRGSWQSEYRPYENFHGESVVLSGVVSNLERPAEGPVLLTWEYANVLFHEFGHALHMLMGRARYPSLGSMAVAWDMIEAPSLLNEHWLYDSTLLRKHMRHFETGEPIPDTLIDGIEAATKYDRVFSVGLEYLSSAIVDMRAHMAADGSDIDVLAIERDAHVEFEMPPAVQPVMHPPQAFHLFAGEAYAAGLYSYLWADVMVADILEAFHQAPGGLHDDKMAQRWRESFLSVGNGVSGDAAFRALRGRNPDPMALLRRFDLAT